MAIAFEDDFQDGDFTDNPAWTKLLPQGTGNVEILEDDGNYFVVFHGGASGPTNPWETMELLSEDIVDFNGDAILTFWWATTGFELLGGEVAYLSIYDATGWHDRVWSTTENNDGGSIATVDLADYDTFGTFKIKFGLHADASNDQFYIDNVKIEVANQPPTAPETILADGNELPVSIYNKMPLFEWPPATDPDGDHVNYIIQIGTAPDESDVLPPTLTGDNTSYEVPVPLAPALYYVQVYAWDLLEYSEACVRELIIQNHAPHPPTEISPDTTFDIMPKITWHGAYDDDNDPITFEIQIGTTPFDDDILSWHSTNDQNYYQITTPLPVGTYYVQIITFDGFEYSNVYQELMEILNSAPTPPTEISPDTSYDKTPYIYWSGADDINNDILAYYIQIGTTSGGDDILKWTYTQHHTYYELNFRLTKGMYFVQLMANDGFANSTPYEETIEILNRPPEPPTAILPDATDRSMPQIYWEGASDPDPDDELALTYYIQLGTTSGGSEIFFWKHTKLPEYTLTTPLSKGIYYVQVKTNDGIQNSTVFQDLLEVTNTIPEPPTIILPDSTADPQPRISWYPGEDPDDGDELTYAIQIGTTPNGSEIIAWHNVNNRLYYEMSIDLLPGTYYVQLKAYDGHAWSQVHEEPMYITAGGNTPPLPPTKILPDYTVNRKPTIRWYGATDPDDDELIYYIRIGTKSYADDILDWHCTGNETSYTLDKKLAVDTTYYVQIKANDGTEDSYPHEETLKITTGENMPPTPPTAIFPDTTADKSPRISWVGAVDPEGEILTYYIQLGTTPGGNEVFSWRPTGYAEYYDVELELEVGLYYVQVKAYDGIDYSEVYEETLKITEFGNVPPTPPTCVLPNYTADQNPTITWSGATDPNGDPLTYFIQIGTTMHGDEIIGWYYTRDSQYYKVQRKLDMGVYYVQIKAFDGIENSSIYIHEMKISDYNIALYVDCNELTVMQAIREELFILVSNGGSYEDNITLRFDGLIANYVTIDAPSGQPIIIDAKSSLDIKISIYIPTAVDCNSYELKITAISESGVHTASEILIIHVVPQAPVQEEQRDKLGLMQRLIQTPWVLLWLVIIIVVILLAITVIYRSKQREARAKHTKRKILTPTTTGTPAGTVLSYRSYRPKQKVREVVDAEVEYAPHITVAQKPQLHLPERKPPTSWSSQVGQKSKAEIGTRERMDNSLPEPGEPVEETRIEKYGYRIKDTKTLGESKR
jgi:hypothetical protein